MTLTEESPNRPAPPRGLWSQVAAAMAFVVGGAAFTVVNTVLVVLANPSWPNPGPQPDLRLYISIVAGVVLAIVFLLGRPGRSFGAGFGTGLVMTTIFMSQCTGQWRNPGGTERENAALKRRAAAEAPIAMARIKAKWVAEKRRLGLDQGEGVEYVLWAATCALRHRDSVGEYPPTEDDWPLVNGCSGSADPLYNASGWHIAYTRVRDPRSSSGVGFRIRAVPDTSLRMAGPLLETDQRGIVMRRDSVNTPGRAVGSPLTPVYALLFGCIRANSDVSGTGPKGTVTLQDLIFTRQRGCGNMQIFRFESGPPAFDPNVALLNVPTTGLRRFNVAAQYQLLYVPHGKKPDAGYDLQLTPRDYGSTGIRSYLLTGGAAHVTWEQRRATIADPLADACELDLSQPCSR